MSNRVTSVPRRVFWFLPLAAAVICIAWAQAPAQKGPVQPIPYSHKKHLAMGLECKNCHTMPDPGDYATIPATSICMGCHQSVKTDSPWIQKLASYHERKEPVPWVRIYTLPDFVYFSHKQHLDSGKATCETCHGQVRERDVMFREKDLSMASCMDCHRMNGAPTDCTTCHDER